MDYLVRDGQGMRMDDLMVKHDAVERAVYAIVDIVCGVVSKKQRLMQREGPLTHDVCTFMLFLGLENRRRESSPSGNNVGR